MKQSLLLLSCLYWSGVSSFTTQLAGFSFQQRSVAASHGASHLAAASSSEAEALFEKARKLKAEAEESEHELHTNLLEKKGALNQELDNNIDKLIPKNDDSVQMVAKRLKEGHWSTDRLLQIVQRLHDREMAAQGKGQVTASVEKDRTQFDRVTKTNEEELSRVRGLIDNLIDAADLIDEEFMVKKRQAKDAIYLNHAELEHWTVGELAKNLRGKVKELRRGHSDEYQERLESFYEAQRKKDLPPKDNSKDRPKP